MIDSREELAFATPIAKLAVESIPSLAPTTAARNQLLLWMKDFLNNCLLDLSYIMPLV
jgi:hypothetical protein